MDECLRNECNKCKNAYRCYEITKEDFFSDIYKKIFDILYSNGIKSSKDLKKFKSLFSNEYDFVADIFWLIKRNYSKIYNSGFDIIIESYNFNENISCLFPTRVLFKSTAFIIVEEKDCEIEFIPLDFIQKMFRLKNALLNGICCLLPLRIYKDCYEHPFKDYMDSLYYWSHGKRGIEVINNNDLKIKEINHIIQRDNLNTTEILVNLPFFNSININEYVDLVLTHSDEYKQFLYCIKKHNVSSYKEWCDEIDYNISKLNVIYNNKLKELIKRGIETSFGLAVSIGLMQYPGLEELKYITSGKTVYDGLKFIDDICSMKNSLNQNDYWILWKAINNKII